MEGEVPTMCTSPAKEWEHIQDIGTLFNSLEDLPAELQQNFTRMRDLDIGVQGPIKKLDSTTEDYLINMHNRTAKDRSTRMGDINKMFSRVKEYGERKVSLAMQTYEMVDQHIRQLDQDLARFESEIKEKTTVPTKGAESTRKSSKQKKDRGEAGPSSSSGTSSSKKKKATPSRERSVSPASGAALPSTEVIDMPVDPNEPTYCVCNEVSYGSMIGCDNTECPVEWFHFPCVGLTSKPKGKWFCPRCSAERKNKSK